MKFHNFSEQSAVFRQAAVGTQRARARIAELERDDVAFARPNALGLRNPSAFNFLDACALSLPCHPRDTAPVGLMLAAAPHHDDALLAIGQAVEAVLATIR